MSSNAVEVEMLKRLQSSWRIVFGYGLVVLVNINTILAADRLKKERDENEKLRRKCELILPLYPYILEADLGAIAEELHLPLNECRLSLFRPVCNGFKLLSRYSKNPRYREVDVSFLPLDCDFAKSAWEKGHADMELEKEMSVDNRLVLKMIYKYDDDDAARIRIKAKRAIAVRVPDGLKEEHLGILVIELEGQAGLDYYFEQRLRECCADSAYFEVARRFREAEPDWGLATREGF